MRLLGLDVGEARIGVAVSDPSGTVATPVTVLDARALESDLRPLLRLIEDYEAGGIVVGLPLTLAGEEGPQARAIRERVAGWSPRLGVPVTFSDERLTTAQARRSLQDAGLDGRAQRKAIDAAAATLILQNHLDSLRDDRDPPYPGGDE